MRAPEERAVVIGSDLPEAETLEGLYLRAAPDEDGAGGGAIVAAPHPLYGGSMDNPVVSELAHAAGKAGMASLRFNWRGVGASAGARSGDLRYAALDCAAALAQIAETVEGPLVASGYSFGAAALTRLAALATRDAGLGARVQWPRVRRLLLVAPPPAMLEGDALAAFRGSVLVVGAEHDDIAPPAELERLAGRLPRARFVRIEEADHFFGAGLGPLGREASAWLGAPTGS
ncbi:MAG TPA: hypothetical protein VMW35_20710 [Myxococcota bacterium]|jgi:alpha/beta superfamily hydrolase|nr:hypothetical protein [Myxococcota bacterium]